MMRDTKPRGAARMLGFVVACACALALTALAIVRGLDAIGGPTPYVNVASVGLQLKVLDVLAQRSSDSPETRVAFLSDSTSMHFPEGALGLNQRFGAALVGMAPQESHFRVFTFASPGYTPFAQYFLAHRVADAGPDHVVLGFNLASFSQQWRGADRPELSAMLPVRNLGEALRLPLHWIGLSTDELLLYTMVVHFKGFQTWLRLSQEQARCVRAWGSAAEWLQARSGAPNGLVYQTLYFFQRRQAQFLPGPPERETEMLARARYGAALTGVGPDHPVLRILRATLEVFRERRIPVLVYIIPMNVEHLEQLGLLDRAGLRRSVESVRREALASGASLVDLHDLLPDAAFSDGAGHLGVGAPLDAPPIVAKRIAQALLTARGTR
jgi:hypothetical protein